MQKKEKTQEPQDLESLFGVVMANKESIPEFSSLIGEDLCSGDNEGGGCGCS
jgi:hypothetical protein